jgi:hypothetical protein
MTTSISSLDGEDLGEPRIIMPPTGNRTTAGGRGPDSVPLITSTGKVFGTSGRSVPSDRANSLVAGDETGFAYPVTAYTYGQGTPGSVIPPLATPVEQASTPGPHLHSAAPDRPSMEPPKDEDAGQARESEERQKGPPSGRTPESDPLFQRWGLKGSLALIVFLLLSLAFAPLAAPFIGSAILVLYGVVIVIDAALGRAVVHDPRIGTLLIVIGLGTLVVSAVGLASR